MSSNEPAPASTAGADDGRPERDGRARRTDRFTGWARPLLPGLAIGAVGLVGAQLVAGTADAVSPIVVAVALGILLRNVGALPAAADPGLTFAAKKLLRVGVVLLGFRLALGDLFEVGVPALAVVIVVVLGTLGFTYWLGRRMSLAPELALLTGTGFAICGATAVAAIKEVVGSDDDAPAFAIALVTVFGTLAIVVLPLLATLIGLTADAFGQWAGAAVHDVGQVVATAAAGGEDALAVAVVVKLTRVLMLGPILIGVGLWWRRRTGSGGEGTRPALVPPFIVAFVVAVVIRSLGVLPDAVVEGIRTAEVAFFTIALLGLGAGVRLAGLRRVGGRALLVGSIAFVFVAGVAFLGVLAVHGTSAVANG
jgi:uncharacterized integral membrane protein (TIGR00698 family)